MTSSPKAIRPAVNGWNPEFLEAEYTRWKADPGAVASDLAQFFLGFDLASASPPGARAATNGSAVARHAAPTSRAAGDREQSAVSDLIEAYRKFGHLCAAIDPFGRERPGPEILTPQFHGLGESDLDRAFDAGSLSPDGSPMALREIIEVLDTTYCRTIGVEFSHITSNEEWRWLADRMESCRSTPDFDRGTRAHILYQLHRSELFEKFCGKRYPGVKRFSLEGAESLIPMLDSIIELAGDFDVAEFVMGMSHRGRLNVLTNIVGKTYEEIFTEFEDAWMEDAALGGGDVKYHRGYSAARLLRSGKHVWVCMASNPSHLESVCPVVLGRARAKQLLSGDTRRERHIPLLIHGDAAFIGQGVVAETLNLSQLTGYTVGGTVHIVVNNLIGFTTGSEDARSSRYCTDIAKMLEVPIFHVNAEDPDACVFVARLAFDYRMKFHKDVVIDLVCYRRHGHNETDEAAFTQPLLYEQIKKMPSVLTTYAERLQHEKVIPADDVEKIRRSLDEELDRAYEKIKKAPVDPTPDPGHRRWVGFTDKYSHEPVETGVKKSTLDDIARAISRWPESFTPHRKLIGILKDRTASVLEDKPIDWATGEALAIGSLLCEGSVVRLTGQDSRRGTFSQRHAALRDMLDASVHVPLNHVHEVGVPGDPERAPGTRNEKGETRQALLKVYDSPLSEFACVGFEYGYSLASPEPLVMWEAQFGDFVNGAQVIIDQFISSAEVKWQRWSGLVLLLPHGYEGQGPEHSSGRLERFLKLSGRDNIQVAYPTTPAQYFHLLRRQVRRNFRKPLIVMTPKSLLRSPVATSRVADMTSGHFQEVIDDPQMTSAGARKKVNRLILCSGKVFYDLAERRQQSGRNDVAIVRVEQLYPLHMERLKSVIESYGAATELLWVQEEPQNQGAWVHMFMSLREALNLEPRYAGRPVSASPATGSPRKHAEQLEAFLTDAIGPAKG